MIGQSTASIEIRIHTIPVLTSWGVLCKQRNYYSKIVNLVRYALGHKDLSKIGATDEWQNGRLLARAPEIVHGFR